MTTFEGSQDGKGLRVGIVCSRFNEFIVSALLDGAKRGLANHGVAESDIDIAWVPGGIGSHTKSVRYMLHIRTGKRQEARGKRENT